MFRKTINNLFIVGMEKSRQQRWHTSVARRKNAHQRSYGKHIIINFSFYLMILLQYKWTNNHSVWFDWHVQQNLGQFYSGDSYIVMNTYTKGDSPKKYYDIHFWLGSVRISFQYWLRLLQQETTQDEAGVGWNDFAYLLLFRISCVQNCWARHLFEGCTSATSRSNFFLHFKLSIATVVSFWSRLFTSAKGMNLNNLCLTGRMAFSTLLEESNLASTTSNLKSFFLSLLSLKYWFYSEIWFLFITVIISYKPRLLWIKGKKQVRVIEVSCSFNIWRLCFISLWKLFISFWYFCYLSSYNIESNLIFISNCTTVRFLASR